jgi:hypothetical protein
MGELPSYSSVESEKAESRERVIPLFALDAKGKPVTDLRKEELSLSLNGESLEIKDFREQPEGIGRTVFLFFDGVHNTVEGRKRSVDIAVELMRLENPRDTYYIFSFSQEQGLELREGPTSATGELIHNLEDHWVIPYPQSVDNVLDAQREQEALSKYENHIAQLHYALRNITGSKLAFILSEGPTSNRGNRQKDENIGFKRRSVRDYMLNRLMETVKFGGAVLSMVDPGNRRELKDFAYLFDRTEGLFKAQYEQPVDELLMGSEENFIGGSKIEQIAAAVRVIQGAGYLIEFDEPSEIPHGVKLSITCKRMGVYIQAPRYTAAEYTYDGMEEGLKTLFALNVVDNGNWSRMICSVRQVACKIVEKKETPEGASYKIELPIPEELRNKEADIFLVCRQQNDSHPEVTKHTRVLKENEQIECSRQERNNRIDVVIIEPRTLCCLKSVIQDKT